MSGAARAALNQLAADMSAAAGRKVKAIEAAHGVLDIVTANMERALRHISVERGHDPREFTLIPFGGAGGLHAIALARALRIPRVLLPALPGALSAVGVLLADVVKEQSRTVMIEVTSEATSKLNRVFREMETQATEALRREGFSRARQKHERSLAVRYKGQSFELQIKTTSGNIVAAFHRAHRRVTVTRRRRMRLRSSARECVRADWLRKSANVASKKVQDRRPVPATSQRHILIDAKISAPVYRRASLAAGSRLRTPCILTEYSATTLITADCRATVDARGNVIIELS
jgi:N-methylhydantoinase A